MRIFLLCMTLIAALVASPAWADGVMSGNCPVETSLSQRTLQDLSAVIHSAAMKDAEAFTESAAISFAENIGITVGIAIVTASAPAWVVPALAVVGVGYAIFRGVQIARQWHSMTTLQKWSTAGSVVGSLAGSGVKPSIRGVVLKQIKVPEVPVLIPQ